MNDLAGIPNLVKEVPDAPEESPANTNAEAAPANTNGEPEPANTNAEPEPPKPDPVAERVAKRVAAAKRIEMRAAAERERLRTERAEAEAIIAKARAIKSGDPSVILEELGLTNREFLYRVANGNPEPTIEDQVKQAREKAAAAKRALDEYRAGLQREQQERELRTVVERGVREFVDEVTSLAPFTDGATPKPKK